LSAATRLIVSSSFSMQGLPSAAVPVQYTRACTSTHLHLLVCGLHPVLSSNLGMQLLHLQQQQQQ
jgi:hypothetical protein